MKLRILSWNVRGANDLEKRKVIKTFLKDQRADLVYLQETKIPEVFTGILRSLGGGRFIDLRTLDCRGASRGVLVFWDNKILEVTEIKVGSFLVTCRFINCEDGAFWCFLGVYSPMLKS